MWEPSMTHVVAEPVDRVVAAGEVNRLDGKVRLT
jgi:hypothetical protein